MKRLYSSRERLAAGENFNPGSEKSGGIDHRFMDCRLVQINLLFVNLVFQTPGFVLYLWRFCRDILRVSQPPAHGGAGISLGYAPAVLFYIICAPLFPKKVLVDFCAPAHQRGIQRNHLDPVRCVPVHGTPLAAALGNANWCAYTFCGGEDPH